MENAIPALPKTEVGKVGTGAGLCYVWGRSREMSQGGERGLLEDVARVGVGPVRMAPGLGPIPVPPLSA